MSFSKILTRLFGGKPEPVRQARAPEPVKAAVPQTARGTQPIVVAVAELWTPRNPDYWPDRAERVMQHLRRDWEENPEQVKWPDAMAVLDLLSAPTEEVIRQLPAAAREAIALCDNASLSRVALGDKLSRDPSLVQGLLRQANGAYYGGGLNPVLRVDAAIDRIGIAATRAIVLASCVDGLLSKPGAPYDRMLASVWTHMVNSGPLARDLALSFGADAEEAFAVALLHDVGKLVIFDCISTLRATKRGPVSLPETFLSSVIEHLHEPLGAMAAQRWGLGATAADAIGSHHRRERPAHRHPLAETLFVAERTEHAMRKQVALDVNGVWSLGQLSGDCASVLHTLGQRVKAA